MHAMSQSRTMPSLALRLPRLTRSRVFAGVACLMGGFIAVNATLFQTEKHPAPMFRQLAKPAPLTSLPLPPLRPEIRESTLERTQSIPASVSAVKERPPLRDKMASPATSEVSDLLVSDIQTELLRRGFYKGEPDGKLGPGTSKAIRDFQFSQRVVVDGMPSEALLSEIRAVRATMKDELLDLVKRSGTQDKAAPAAKKAEAVPKAEPEKPSKTVADVQRALNKAGYGPLAEDGRMGAGTKAAIAKFEADRKLPARGEPKGPMLKHLAQASGMKITP
jgi:peptidoglycan hydrolase-like protein with peptidoglycan-binding domain